MRYDMHVHLKPEQVLDEAVRFFGPDGRQMTQAARQGLQISFFGPGLAWITCWPPDAKGGTRVDLDSSERDADILAFMDHLRVLAGGPPSGPGAGPSHDDVPGTRLEGRDPAPTGDQKPGAHQP
jgi:hypothetical protein